MLNLRFEKNVSGFEGCKRDSDILSENCVEYSDIYETIKCQKQSNMGDGYKLNPRDVLLGYEGVNNPIIVTFDNEQDAKACRKLVLREIESKKQNTAFVNLNNIVGTKQSSRWETIIEYLNSFTQKVDKYEKDLDNLYKTQLYMFLENNYESGIYYEEQNYKSTLILEIIDIIKKQNI